MRDSLNLKLPDFIYSHEQIGLYLLQLDHYKTILLKEKVKGTSALGPGTEKRGNISPELKKYVDSATSGKPATQELLEEVYKFLKKAHDTGPRLHLTLATLPNETFKRDMVAWARQNIDELALVSFNYDRSIVGGVIVRTRNKIFDFSYSKKLLNPSKKISEFVNERTK